MFATFTLTGRHTTPSGQPHKGQVLVAPNTVIRDTTGDVVMSGQETATLDETGAWSLVLPCDDPTLNPSTGIGYRVGYALHSTSMTAQSFYATADMAGSTLDVSDIVTVSVPAPLSAIVTPQATSDVAGTIQLAGDLAGTAEYPHYRSSLSEKTTAANVIGCIIQGSGVTKRGLVIDGTSRTTYQGNWFAGHVTEHVQTTSNADRTWVGPNTFSLGIPDFTDGSASTVRMDYDYSNLCARTDVMRLQPRALNPAVLAQGQLWWASGTDQFKVRDASAIRTGFTGWQGTATLDFPSIAPGATAELNVTVTGSATGDSVTLAPPSTIAAGLMWAGYVSAANTVTVRLVNTTGGAIDPVSAGWKVNVIRS